MSDTSQVSSWFRRTLQVATRGRGLIDLTAQVGRFVADAPAGIGLCQVFVQHTSASLLLCENADPDVQRDLETWISNLVSDGSPLFRHTVEGPDDMAAHVRSMLTGASLTLPVADGRLLLGTWQGIYLWEHRYAAQERRVVLTLQLAPAPGC